MKNRNILMMLGIVIACICGSQSVDAQKFTTVSGNVKKMKVRNTNMGKRLSWIVKAGGGVMGKVFGEVNDILRGNYSLSFGMQYRLNDYGFYIGGKLGSSMTVLEYESRSSYHYNDDYDYWWWESEWGWNNLVGVSIGPEFGLCHSVGRNLEVDASLGIGYLYAIPRENKWHKRQLHQFNPDANIGLWYRNILFSLSYSPTLSTYDGAANVFWCDRVFFNLGFRF